MCSLEGTWKLLEELVPRPEENRNEEEVGSEKRFLREEASQRRKLLEEKNKPKEYPQQPETKTVAKHAMSEVCLLPRPSYSRGRAYKAQSQHKHFIKNRFSKRVRNTSRSSCEGFFPKNCCPPHSSLYLPNIHHPHLLCPLHHLRLLYHLLHHLL